MSAHSCDFCGTTDAKLVVGPNVSICEHCVRRSYLYINDWPSVEPKCGICSRTAKDGVELEHLAVAVCAECEAAAKEAMKERTNGQE